MDELIGEDQIGKRAKARMGGLHALFSVEISECIKYLMLMKEASSAFLAEKEVSWQQYGVYMTHLTDTMNAVRKLSIHLHENSLEAKIADLASVLMMKVSEAPVVSMKPPEDILAQTNSELVVTGSSDLVAQCSSDLVVEISSDLVAEISSDLVAQCSSGLLAQSSSDAVAHTGGPVVVNSDCDLAPQSDNDVAAHSNAAAHNAPDLVAPALELMLADQPTKGDGATRSKFRSAPTFQFYEGNLTLKERYDLFTYKWPDLGVYEPGQRVRLATTKIADLQNLLFYVADSANNVGKQLARNVLLGIQGWPPYTKFPGRAEVFGLLVNGLMYRAVAANIPVGIYRFETGKELVMAIDTGELVWITEKTTIYQLPPELQQQPGVAIMAKLYDGQSKDITELQQMLCGMKHAKFEYTIKSVCGNMLILEYIGATDPPSPAGLKANLEEPLAIEDNQKSDPQQNTESEEAKEDRDTNSDGTEDGHSKKHEDTKKDVTAHDDCSQEEIHSTTVGNIVAKKGDVINVTVMEILDVNRMYAFIQDSGDPQSELVWGPNDIPDTQRLDQLPELSQIVLAKYLDYHWYRARVEEIFHALGRVRIFFVDYGNELVVFGHELAYCPEHVAQQPFQAVLCRLADLRVGKAPEERQVYVHFIKEELRGTNIDVKVEGSNQNELLISLVDEKQIQFVGQLQEREVLVKPDE